MEIPYEEILCADTLNGNILDISRSNGKNSMAININAILNAVPPIISIYD
jgi:hypothetical protein